MNIQRIFLIVAVMTTLSCTKQDGLLLTDNKAADRVIAVIPIESALAKLDEFLSGTKQTKASNTLSSIISIETHFSITKRDVLGNALPDAYLINYKDDGGFAILGANTDVDPIVAVVEAGNSTWESLLNPQYKAPSLYDFDCIESDLMPEQLLSMCVYGALYGCSVNDYPNTKDVWSTEILPLTTNQLFEQSITYCHKSNRGFVKNGSASTALAITMAYNQYPHFYVDHELMNYSACNTYDGLGYRYTFADANCIFLKKSDYFTNYNLIPEVLSLDQRLDLITMVDPGVINTHNTPQVSAYANQYFYRTRNKLYSGLFYLLSNIIQSWNYTLSLPGAVKIGLENLGYNDVIQQQKTSLTSSQIQSIKNMLEANTPVVMCGWTLLSPTEGHFWIVDGIRMNSNQTHIHCNWGWGGYNNGWFSSSCIRPTEPVPTMANGNSWGNIVVYTYTKMAVTPTVSNNEFYDNIPCQYE